MLIDSLFIKTTYKATAKAEERVQYWTPTLYPHIDTKFFSMYDLVLKSGKAQTDYIDEVITRIGQLTLKYYSVKFLPLTCAEVEASYVDVFSASHSALRGNTEDTEPFIYRGERVFICSALVTLENCNFYEESPSRLLNSGLNKALNGWFGEQLQAACTEEYFDALRKLTIDEYLAFYQNKVNETRRSLDDLGMHIFQKQIGR